MRILEGDLHWGIIVSKYLDVRDMARFEAAVDNHGLRISLSLPMPRSPSPVSAFTAELESSELVDGDSTNDSSSIALSSYSYSNISLEYSRGYMTEISSLEMLEWCNNRRLCLRRVHLMIPSSMAKTMDPTTTYSHGQSYENISPNRNYSPLVSMTELEGMDESISEAMLVTKNIRPFASSTWNAYNFIEELKLTSPIDKSTVDMIQQCERMTSFMCNEPITKKLLMVITNQLTSNETRPIDSSMESWQREHLELNMMLIDSEGLEYLVKHLSSVKSFDFHQSVGIDDQAMTLIGEHWKDVNAVSIRSSLFTDKGLAELCGIKRMKSISLLNCPNISASGLTKIIKHFSHNLAELTISLLEISKDDLT